MKKIIALALALIMALSMGVVALAADAVNADATVTLESVATDIVAPGEEFILVPNFDKVNWKLSGYDFTSAKYDFKGASLIDSIALEKQADKSFALVLTLKENLTSSTDKDIAGVIDFTHKTNKVADANGKMVPETFTYYVTGTVGNDVKIIDGEKKADQAYELSTTTEMDKNTVMFFEDNGGYVTFTDGYSLTGTVKAAKGDKVQVYFDTLTEDETDAIEAYLGEDYDAIVEEIKFSGTGFGADVDFRYDAWEEDPHFFYAWDGEKFVDLEAKYDDDEDVDDYVFTAAAKGIIIVTDKEIVAAAEETKNPDTGANDVVGVAAALAVVSLVAAGAVSLKK